MKKKIAPLDKRIEQLKREVVSLERVKEILKDEEWDDVRDKCDFPHILALLVKHIVAEPLVQKPVESKHVPNECVGYCGSDSTVCSISWQ